MDRSLSLRKTKMEILKLSPEIKETIWGGRKLIDEYGFSTDKKNAAEAWLLSCHKDGPCTVQNGQYAGKTLAEVLETEGKAALGASNAGRTDFPILIKLIDAEDKLSVQVHPGDAYARRVENENGKTEAWYVLQAAPGASLVYGVNTEMTRAAFSESIENGTLMQYLNTVEVHPGDVVFIPSGMLHAIGAGILLAEVQQSSNTTYRVFDYMRRDKNGKLRDLHVKKATDVVDLRPVQADFSPKGEAVPLGQGEAQLLTDCPYFSMTRLTVDGEVTRTADGDSFVSLLVLDGEGKVFGNAEALSVKKGDSLFIPAGFGAFTLDGGMTLLETRT